MSLTDPTPAPSPRTVPIALFAVAVLLVGGIGIAGTAAYFEVHPAGTTGPGGPSGPGNATAPRTVTLTDDLGRTVTVPVDPARVVSLSPSVTDSMELLGLAGHLVGVDCYAVLGLAGDYTSAQIAAWNLTTSMCVEAGPSLDVEELLNDTPQLVLVATTTSESSVEELTATYHLPVLVLQPSTLGGIEVDVGLLAQIFPSAAGRAAALQSSMQVELERASALATNLSDNGTTLPSVLLTYYTDSSGYYTFGPGTFGESLLEMASASNIAAATPLEYPELSGSQVLVANPWAVIYATGFGLNLSSYAQAPDWSSLNATSDGHAWGIDSTLLTEPDPAMILEGLPTLLALLHPNGG